MIYYIYHYILEKGVYITDEYVEMGDDICLEFTPPVTAF